MNKRKRRVLFCSTKFINAPASGWVVAGNRIDVLAAAFYVSPMCNLYLTRIFRFGLRLILLVGCGFAAPAQTGSGQSKLNETRTIDLGAGVKMEVVLIHPGTFQMGADKNPEEKPPHPVTITAPFYLGKYLVTQEQWEKVMGSNPSEFKGVKNPVDSVSWNDCQVFLKKLKDLWPELAFRLPTEAEWEYACRAGSTTEYNFGEDEAQADGVAWDRKNSGLTSHPVGEKKPNAWGLYDMPGNVWEWCQDFWHANYSGAPADGSAWQGGTPWYYVARGGSWNNYPSYLRAARRVRNLPTLRLSYYGLRVVLPAGGS